MTYKSERLYYKDIFADAKGEVPLSEKQKAMVNKQYHSSYSLLTLTKISNVSRYEFVENVNPYQKKKTKKLDIGNIWYYQKNFKTKTLKMLGGGVQEGTCTKPKKLSELVDWQFKKGDSTINTYECKKAVDKISGAVAWYTLSLSISDGPKHFSGLPGLVVLLLDEKKNEKIELTKVAKLEKEELESYECEEEITYESYAGKKKGLQLLKKKPSVEIKK